MAAQKDEWQQWEGWWWRVDSVTGWWQRAERVDMRAEAARSVRGPSLMQQLSVDPSGRTPEVSSPIDPVPSMGACSAPAMQPWCEAALGMQPTAVPAVHTCIASLMQPGLPPPIHLCAVQAMHEPFPVASSVHVCPVPVLQSCPPPVVAYPVPVGVPLVPPAPRMNPAQTLAASEKAGPARWHRAHGHARERRNVRRALQGLYNWADVTRSILAPL